jgi:ATP-binding cassette subfamily D (ALD) long-chain fatty acid import protein
VDFQPLDSPISDQRVTADITQFSTELAELYTSLFKPLLDVLLFTHQLTNILGWQGPAIMYAYFFASGCVKRVIMPAFGKVRLLIRFRPFFF